MDCGMNSNLYYTSQILSKPASHLVFEPGEWEANT